MTVTRERERGKGQEIKRERKTKKQREREERVERDRGGGGGLGRSGRSNCERVSSRYTLEMFCIHYSLRAPSSHSWQRKLGYFDKL